MKALLLSLSVLAAVLVSGCGGGSDAVATDPVQVDAAVAALGADLVPPVAAELEVELAPDTSAAAALPADLMPPVS